MIMKQHAHVFGNFGIYKREQWSFMHFIVAKNKGQ